MHIDRLLKWEDPVRQNVRFVYQVPVNKMKNEAARKMDLTFENQDVIFEGMAGTSGPVQKIYRLIRQFADSDANVLITGETGTGKELVARALHNTGRRRNSPMIRVSCNEIPEALMETHLFGFARGAFTGGTESREGYFEAAQGGTVFLDGITDMPLNMQAKLLQVVDRKEIIRVGESTMRKVDIRIVAATNADMPGMIREGTFREDLGFRLKGVTIHVPPLRERTEDIPGLTRHFLSQFTNTPISVSEELYDGLKAYPWPGNVRQLKNVMEYAASVCRGNVITYQDLPEGFGSGRKKASPKPDRKKLTKKNILKVLKQTNWNRTKSARILGCSRSTLYRKIESFDIFEEI